MMLELYGRIYNGEEEFMKNKDQIVKVVKVREKYQMLKFLVSKIFMR